MKQVNIGLRNGQYIRLTHAFRNLEAVWNRIVRLSPSHSLRDRNRPYLDWIENEIMRLTLSLILIKFLYLLYEGG
jgi:hypothetical protein